MSVESISSSQNFYQPNVQNNGKQFRQSFNDLAQALQSGDLSGAQSAFSELQQLRQSFQSAHHGQGKGNDKNGPLKSDIAALDQALQSGDISKAQEAFKKLQSDMQAMRKNHHQHQTTGVQNQADINATTPLTNSTSDADGDNDGSVTAGNIVNVSA